MNGKKAKMLRKASRKIETLEKSSKAGIVPNGVYHRHKKTGVVVRPKNCQRSIYQALKKL